MADVLKVTKNNITNTSGACFLDGVSGDSQTVISIILCEIAGADETFDITHTTAGEGTPRYIYKSQSLPANATFEHTSKIVVDDTDEIWVSLSTGTGSVDVILSYLQQDD